MNLNLPFWEDKCWGRVMHCFHNSQASVSYLEVMEGYRCSKHWHAHRANTFIVIQGVIVVEEWDKDTLQPDEVTTLIQGDTLTVPSTKVHRFKVLESGKMIEVYYPDRGGEVDINDIIRLDVGGKI